MSQFYHEMPSTSSINNLSECNPNMTDKINAFKQMCVFVPGPLRLSFSPQKAKTASKKILFQFYNKSFKKVCENGQEGQLESIIKKEKIILTSKKQEINKSIAPSIEILSRQNDVISFPTIDTKKVSESPIKINSTRKYRQKNSSEILVNLTQSRKQHPSKILFKAINNERKIKSIIANPEDKLTTSKMNAKRTNSDVCQEPSSSSISNHKTSEYKHSKSLARLEIFPECDKKNKKGYLIYDQQAHVYWQNFKSNLQKEVNFRLQSTKMITARAFYVLELDKLSPVLSHKIDQQIQIASLTKIMTCYLTILICKKYGVDMRNCIYRVPDKISDTPGTTAELEAGDLLSVEDLLYGLMLPSGNDAAICLAEAIGKIIQKYRPKGTKKSYTETFLHHMNLFSRQLNLDQEWNNSHGLSSNPNYSTPKAILALSALAMKNPFFQKIVATREFEIQIKNDRYGLIRKKVWKNTNKLLQLGWEGVKTGTTQTAGHCLISKKQNLLIGVFDCQTMSKRFSECLKIYDYIMTKKKR